MKMNRTWRHLKNLGTSACVEGPPPWEFNTRPDPKLGADKKLREGWITAKTTQHYVYGVAEGLNPNQRVTKPSKEGEGNPPHSVWGLAADFDSPYTVEDVLARIPTLSKDHIPQWYERTLSGNARLVWVFESPVIVPSFTFASAFLTFVSERLRCSMLLAGLDHKATTNPSRYFTNSGEWYAIPGGKAIPVDLVEGWLIEAGRTFKFYRDPDTRGDDVGDLAPIREALAARYPRFSEWPGQFEIGEMGPSFWVEGSTSHKSATVRAGGLQTFAAHAAKGFYTWSDLVDVTTVKDMQAKNTSAATRDVFFDTQAYWVPDPIGSTWVTIGKENLDTYLVTERKCSPKVDPATGVSPLCEAKLHIAMHNRVEGVGHAVFFPSGLIRAPDGRRVLNISTRAPLAPSEERGVEWGPGGQIPFLSSFYEHLFPDEVARIAWLGWLGYAYSGALARRPAQGQVAFVAGPPGVGKSMQSQGILSPLFGGCADASAYLHGKDSFGGELFESFFWRSDDNGLFVDPRTRAGAAERMKALAANPEQRVHAKYRMPSLMPWFGRLVCTMNCDPDSLSQMPELTSSLEGKISLFRTGEVATPELGLGREWVEATLAREIAFFARWLLEHPPKQLGAVMDSRYGVAAFHDASLLAESKAQSSTAIVRDLVDDWRHTVDNTAGGPWRGTVARLRMEMTGCAARSELLRSVPLDRFRRDIQKLASGGADWLRVRGQMFEVDLPLTPEKVRGTVDVPVRESSAYHK